MWFRPSTGTRPDEQLPVLGLNSLEEPRPPLEGVCRVDQEVLVDELEAERESLLDHF